MANKKNTGSRKRSRKSEKDSSASRKKGPGKKPAKPKTGSRKVIIDEILQPSTETITVDALDEKEVSREIQKRLERQHRIVFSDHDETDDPSGPENVIRLRKPVFSEDAPEAEDVRLQKKRKPWIAGSKPVIILSSIVWIVALVLFVILIMYQQQLIYPYEPFRTCCEGLNPDFVKVSQGDFEEACCEYVADKEKCLSCIENNKMLKAKTEFLGGGNPKNLFYILSFSLLAVLVIFIPMYFLKEWIQKKSL
jgi:hypothetical protein